MLEAMQLGKPVLNFNRNGGDGYVDKDNFMKMAKTNFSGWSMKTIPSVFEGVDYETVEREILKFNPEDCLTNKILIENNLDPKLYLDKILKL